MMFETEKLGVDQNKLEQLGRQFDAAAASTPEPIVDRSTLGEMGAGFKRGLFVAVPEMAGGAIKAYSDVDSDWYKRGQDLQDSAKAIAGLPDFQKSKTADDGLVNKVLVSGTEGVGQMAPIIAGGVVNPYLGAGMAATMYGGSTYQDTKERMLKQEGIDDAYAAANPNDPRVVKAKNTGLATGGIQGLGEGAMSLVGGKFVKAALPNIGKATVETVLGNSAKPGLAALKQYAKGLGLELAGETITEPLQDEGQAAVERAAGLKDAPKFMEQAAQSAQGGFGTALLLAPFGIPAHIAKYSNNAAVQKALVDPAVNPQARSAAAHLVAGDLAKVDPEAASNFMQHAAVAIGDEATTGSAPYALDLSDPSLLKPFATDANSPQNPALPDTSQASGLPTGAESTPAPGGAIDMGTIPEFGSPTVARDSAPVAGNQYQQFAEQPFSNAPAAPAIAGVGVEGMLNNLKPVDEATGTKNTLASALLSGGNPYQQFAEQPFAQAPTAPAIAGVGVEGMLNNVQPAASSPRFQALQWAGQQLKDPATSKFERQNITSMVKAADPEKKDLVKYWASFTGQRKQPAAIAGVQKPQGVAASDTQSGKTSQVTEATPVIAPQPLSSNTVVTQKPPRDRSVQPAQDDLITAIGKLGGLNRDQAIAQWGNAIKDSVSDLNKHATRNGKVGLLHVISSKGKSLDAMREALEEHGYLPQGSSIEDMYAKIDQHFTGKQSYSNQHQGQVEDQDLSQAPEGVEESDYPFSLEGINFPEKERKRLKFLKQMLKNARNEKTKAQARKALQRFAEKNKATVPDLNRENKQNIAVDDLKSLKKGDVVIHSRNGFRYQFVGVDQDANGNKGLIVKQFLKDDTLSKSQSYLPLAVGLQRENKAAANTKEVKNRQELPRSESVSARGLVDSDAFVSTYLNEVLPALRSAGITPFAIVEDVKSIIGNYRELRLVLKRGADIVGYVTRIFDKDGIKISLIEAADDENGGKRKMGAIPALYPAEARLAKRFGVDLRGLFVSTVTQEGFKREHNTAEFVGDTGKVAYNGNERFDEKAPFDEDIVELAKSGVNSAADKAYFRFYEAKVTIVNEEDNHVRGSQNPVQSMDEKTAGSTEGTAGTDQNVLAVGDAAPGSVQPGSADNNSLVRPDGQGGLTDKTRNTAKHRAFLQRMLKNAKTDKARDNARKAIDRFESRTKPQPTTIDEEINSMSLDDMAALFNQAAAEAVAPAPVRNRAKLQEARRKQLSKQLAKTNDAREQRRLQDALEKLKAAQAKLAAEAKAKQIPAGIEGLKVTFNAAQSGIELRFAGKPDAETLAKIKANGFRWAMGKKIWYAKDTPSRRSFVEGLQGKAVEETKPLDLKYEPAYSDQQWYDFAGFAPGKRADLLKHLNIEGDSRTYWRDLTPDQQAAVSDYRNSLDHNSKNQETFGGFPKPAEEKTIWNDDGTNGPVAITAPPSTRSASDILGAAAKSGVKGADEALKGLYELFGGKSLKSFPGAVDEDTYRAAKPHFVAAFENFRAAGKSLKEFFSFLIDQFGSGIQPYVMKFMQEKQQESGILKVSNGEETSHDNTANGSTGQGSYEVSQTGTVPASDTKRGTAAGDRSGSVVNDDGNENTDAGGSNGTGGMGSQPTTVRSVPGEKPAGSAELLPESTSLTTPSEPRGLKLSGTNPGNYRITAADDLGGGTRGQKIDANLAAIRLVKQLDKEGRYPTRDEQAVLVKYTGWGGLKSVFDPNSTKPQDQKARTELEQLLTNAEYFEARQSVLNAHYTSPEIIGSIYQILDHMGFKGGNVLEPTYGSGNFIGLMPEQMAAASKWYGSELDPVTSKIGKFLYPDAQLLESGFQDAEFPYGKFDLAIGNPPFGAEQITDTNKKRAEIDRFKIHNYVIAKSGMHLRPGGVMAMVVTSRFMDTANPEAREYLAKQFKFLTAIRLPNDAFAKNAGTEVTTDLVFFQKLMPGEKPNDISDWLETGATMTNAAGEEITLNKWFAKRPELMLGEPSMQGTMYGGQGEQFTLNARPGQDTAAEIESLLQNDELFGKTKNLFTPTPAKAEAAAVSIQMNREDIGIGGYVAENGEIFMREDDDQFGNPVFVKLTADTPWTEKQTLGETRLNRIKGMLGLVSPTTTGLNADDLQKEFNGLPFSSKIKVVQTAAGLPNFGSKSLFSKMVEGQYKDGTIYLVAGNLPSVERAKIVALGHELTHAGQSEKLTSMAVAWFKDAMAKSENGSKFQQATLRILKTEAGKRGYRLTDAADFRKAVQEATAVIAETAYRTGEKAGFMTRLLMYLKHFMRNKLGWKTLPFTDKELAATVSMMMRQGEKNLSNGSGPDGGQYAAAWHGSPHDHNGFSTEKIGTGEGAQAYGWGLYFAGAKDVAEWYKEQLSEGLEWVKPEEASKYPEDILVIAQKAVEKNGGVDGVIKNFKQYQNTNSIMGDIYRLLSDKLVKEKGRLYKVELAPAEDEYLLWDKPLSEQSEKVRDALANDFEALRKDYDGYWNDPINMTGGEFYRGLTAADGVAESTSEYLHSLGIRGIKYLDGNSRNRSIKDIKKAFLAELPEDASFDDVMEMADAGKFNTDQTEFIKALEADDWLGFDYPAQAISAALGNDLNGFDPSQTLRDAVQQLAKDQQFNYVIFNDADVSIEEKYSLASSLSTTQDAFMEAWNETTGADLLKATARTINPFDFSRSSKWFNKVLPEHVKNALAYMFRLPVNQAANDPEKAPFVEAGIAREETRIGFNLALKGWDGRAKATTLMGRLKETYTQWENSDKSTAWGRIQDSYNRMSAAEQHSVNTILDQGDYRYTVYKSLDGAMKNPTIAMTKPTAAVFALYQDVRNHIDTVVADQREKIFTEMARDAGLSKPEIEKHIADYRNELKKRPGWLPRNHGEGPHRANVYHVIEKLEFDVSDLEGGRKKAFLPYYAGTDVTKQMERLVTEINKKYGDDQKDLRLKFGTAIKGDTLLPNGQMSVVGQAADVDLLMQKAVGILPALAAKHADRVAKLKAAHSLASENGATTAELKRLQQEIKEAGDGQLRIKVFMKLHESERALEKTIAGLHKDLKKEMPKNYRTGRKYEIVPDFDDQLTENTYGDLNGDFAMERAQLKALKKAVQQGEISREEADEMKKSIMRTTAEVLMGRGAGRHQIARAPYLIEGYENSNSVQAYTDYMDSTAGMLSKAMYAREQFDNFRFASPKAKRWAEPYIKDTLRNMGAADRASGNARSIASFMMLGFQMSSMLINATQTYTLGVADLGRRTEQNSVKAIARAQKDIVTGKLTADEKLLFDSKIWKLQEMETAVNEMTGSHEGATGKVSQFMHTLTNKAMMPFQEMELLNRRTMLLAAYRVALKDGKNKDEAIAFAQEVNRAVNFEMSRANLPGFARNPVGRTLYALQSFVAGSWNWIYDRATSGEKADMLALLKYGAMLAMIGGAAALPGGDELDKLYRRLYGKSLKLELQNFTRKNLKELGGDPGEMLHEFIWHGIPSAGGYGINISNSIRLNVPLASWITGEATASEAALGVWSGMANKGIMAFKAAAKGDLYRTVEAVAPNVISGGMRAYRQYDRGVTTMGGKQVFDENGQPLKYDLADAAIRSLGFQPIKQSERTELTQQQRKLSEYWRNERTNTVDAIRIADTQQERQKTLKLVQEFNVSLRGSQAAGLVQPITMETIRNAVAQRKSKADKNKAQWQRSYLQ